MLSRFIRLLLIVLLLGTLTIQAGTQPPDWLRNPFYFSAQNEPLKDLLSNFCTAQGVTAVVSPRITDSVSGEFAFARPEVFLDVITRNNGLTWYFDGNSVYFYTLAELDSAVVQLRWLTPERLQATLLDMGLYDARFPWHGLEEERMVYLSGPPRYIDLIRNLVTKLETTASSDMVMRVFRLKHAWADDISLSFMEKELNIPGIASLLRNITGGAAPPPAPRVESAKPVGKLAAQKANSSYTSAPADDSQNWTKAARILADPRLNAVIVWDLRERMPYYEQAIAELDIPVGLVEIRAAIIDVSTNRLDELGISWNISQNAKDGTPQNGFGSIGGANVGSGNNAVNFTSNQGAGLNLSTIYVNGIDQFMARITAIESDGDANVLSRPAVLTLDNVQAMLQKTDTFYVKLQGQEEVDLFNVTYGTVLKVTPHIIDTPEGKQVKLVVNIEDGAQNTTATGSDSIPVVSKSTINTQAIVGESQALVIGGHYFERRDYTDSGIPGLKNIPGFGKLFGAEKYQVQKIERLFVISPKVVDIKAIAQQQNQIKQQTFTRSMITNSTAPAPEPNRGPFAGCMRKQVGPTRSYESTLPQ